jgi:hypothetical protein
MKKTNPIFRDLIWILPASLILGLVLSLLGPGVWWLGWPGYSVLCSLGLLAGAALWRSAGSVPALGWILLVSLVLRLGMGVFLSYVLPEYGDDNVVEQSGQIYRDAFTYDRQAWQLVKSGGSVWTALTRSSGVEDQYGGLTFVLSVTYRVLSPDAHRRRMTMLLAALISTLGVAVAWKAARRAWGEILALILGWIMALYPEFVFAGISQIREPFLILFIAMVLLGLVLLQKENRWTAWVLLAGGVLGLFLFSPGVAMATLFMLGVWTILSGGRQRIPWVWLVGAVVLITLAGWLFSQIIAGTLQDQGGPLTNLVNWLKYSMNFGAYQLTLNSGWLQNIFQSLPEPLHLPFIIGYGVMQPVLPAAIADPAVWPMRLIGVLRGLGWYAMLPLLVYCLRPILKTTDKRQRLAWLWLWLGVWVWILLASARAGGDQWDNPRYRLILLVLQSALAAYALIWARAQHDRWLNRLLMVEGVFLLFFGYWYAARYTNWRAGQVHIFVVIAAILVVSLSILVGGYLRDRHALKTK